MQRPGDLWGRRSERQFEAADQVISPALGTTQAKIFSFSITQGPTLGTFWIEYQDTVTE